MRTYRLLAGLICLGLLAFAAADRHALAQQSTGRYILVQSTTSTENSGLFNHLLPLFTKKTGIEVRVVAVGTGQAIKNAQNGDGDVLFVHDKASEEKFVAAGFGVKRFDVMYNDFIVVGPGKDAAGIAGLKDVVEAYKKIAAAKAPFVSRGDRSGTNAMELRLWKMAGIAPDKDGAGSWYRDIGGGMGQALNAASAIDAYTLSDRGTWLSFARKDSLVIEVESDPRLVNRYDVIELDPQKHADAKLGAAKILADWLASPDGQKAIGDYQIDGQRLFNPSAATPR